MTNPKFTLAELAQLLDVELRGDPSCVIDGIADIQQAQPSQLSFVAGKGYAKFLHSTAAGAVMLGPDLAAEYDGNRLVLDDPYGGYARVSRLFDRKPPVIPGVHPTAVVAADAKIDASAAVGPQCVVEAGAEIGAGTQLVAGVFVGANSRIGRDCLLHPHVTVYHDVRMGDRITVHSSTVIGADGFGFAPTATGWEKIYQLGGVLIGDDVEIGASTTVDRGALSDTVISRGVIIDDQVHLAHNVRIGEFTAIAGCTGVAGSTEIGARCLIGGGVMISGHIKIADDVQFNGASVVTKSVRESGVYSSGTPLQPVRQWQKNAVRSGQLNQLFERVKQLEELQKRKPAEDGNK